MIFRGTVLAILASLAYVEGTKSYAGYKVYRFTPSTENHVELLVQLESSDVDFWRGPTQIGHYSDVMFSPDQLKTHLSGLIDSGMKNEELISDVSSSMTGAKVANPKVAGGIGWEAYYRLEDLYAFLDKMAAEHSDLAEVVTYGQSYECRDLKLLKISKPRVGGCEEKPIVFVEPTIHAREWITTSVTTYIINEVLNGDLRSRLDDFDFYIVMVVNPDGYEYSHTKERFWRKNRSPYEDNDSCIGTDGNRNFEYNWKGTRNPCHEMYSGRKPFSEFETYYLAEYFKPIANRVRFFASIHSYGELILCPWGYTYERYPGYDRFKEVCDRAVDAMKAFGGKGGKFKCQSAAQLYVHHGSSIDWIAGNYPNTTLIYTAELRGGKKNGFDLPKEQILDVCQEFMIGFNIFLDHVLQFSEPS